MKQHLRLLLTAVQTQNRNLVEQVNELTSQVRSLQSAVATLQQQGTADSQQQAKFTVHWRIENWIEKLEMARNEAGSNQLLSRPYYIGHPGYKVCLEAFPDGKQTGKGHLSVYLKLMKGQYDEGLPWPFRLMFTLSVVDQQMGGRDVSRTIDPPIESDSEPFERPRAEKNHGRGWAQFISHDDLQTRHYTKDNCVLVQLEVHLV